MSLVKENPPAPLEHTDGAEYSCATCGDPRPGYMVAYCPTCGRLTKPRAESPPVPKQTEMEIATDGK